MPDHHFRQSGERDTLRSRDRLSKELAPCISAISLTLFLALIALGIHGLAEFNIIPPQEVPLMIFMSVSGATFAAIAFKFI